MAWALHILFTTVQWLKLVIENDMLPKIGVNLKALCYVDDDFVTATTKIWDKTALEEKMLKGEVLVPPELFEL